MSKHKVKGPHPKMGRHGSGKPRLRARHLSTTGATAFAGGDTSGAMPFPPPGGDGGGAQAFGPPGGGAAPPGPPVGGAAPPDNAGAPPPGMPGM